ncbi:glycoside hydrolase family 130 protein [Arachidicoccus terrestris]|uniref:glycoside hydrolase family 130 protein n=1 Tax=Arachidicoccus terrestris TaxID=2875539 RepID=UPI001CC7E03F|nr:endonuclease/exonuclease/phosphatase family protein [Arachidicoccus terrestris]UAY53960.1 endonuclease/exonuclease/phosphatase family protein [Arachidicoccus terrestris]
MRKFSLVLLMLTIGFVSQILGQKYTVGSFNLRYDNKGDSINAWPHRKDKIAELIRFYDFDCLGTQEGLHHQLEQLKRALKVYDYVGVGRDDGQQKGEYAAIFYKKHKFEVLKSGTFWLSGTDLDHPNKGWDAVLPRICSWASFKDKKSGVVFYYFNTHFDHVGVKARSESARLITKMIKNIAGDEPFVLTGDFNVDQHGDSYAAMHNNGIMRDAFETAPVKMAFTGTFNAFNPDAFTESRIDHVFLGGGFKARRYGVLTETYRLQTTTGQRAASDNFPGQVHLTKSRALTLSDHFPILVQCSLESNSNAVSQSLPAWAMGPFLRPRPAAPLLQPDNSTIFRDPMTGKNVHWESGAAFNPAATIKDNKIVVLYRAEDLSGELKIGGHTSRIGYSESTDGIHLARRSKPVLYPSNDNRKPHDWPGGCEDPRVAMTADGLYVMMYTEWDHKTPRLSVATSRDLVHWDKHGEAFHKSYGGKYARVPTKSASIVTGLTNGRQYIQKVNGKYLMYWGEQFVNLATSENLIDWTPMVDNQGELVRLFAPREGYFDSQLTECGPPALITDKGILMLYNGKNASGVKGDTAYPAGAYCGGQVLFDLQEPTKVIGRLDKPFFVPEEPFEKTGQYKDGTVFLEGMAYYKNRWYLYYGCADSRVGVAIYGPKVNQ